MRPEELSTYLKKTETIVGKNWLGTATSEPNDISSYYKKLRYFYRRFHSGEGAMHFPIKQEAGQSHAQGLIYQVLEVDALIRSKEYRKVVELGCGVGFNLIKLAERNPEIEFTGYDLTPENLELAEAKAREKKITNISFRQANFDKLTPEDLNGPDLIFGIEALCHSGELGRLIQVCYRALNPGGALLIFDGYAQKDKDEVSPEIIQAGLYFSRGFFLPNPQYLDPTLQSVTDAGFSAPELTDFTEKILPNFEVFEQGVTLIFRFPRLTRLLIRIGLFPTEWFRHALAGLYGPFLFQQGYAGYFRILARKEG